MVLGDGGADVVKLAVHGVVVGAGTLAQEREHSPGTLELAMLDEPAGAMRTREEVREPDSRSWQKRRKEEEKNSRLGQKGKASHEDDGRDKLDGDGHAPADIVAPRRVPERHAVSDPVCVCVCQCQGRAVGE